ncbi:Protein archease [subsurface metagenome]
MAKYEFINHTADLGIRVRGLSLKELFENAARAMFDLIVDLDTVETRDQMAIEIKGGELEELLADWLRDLLYRYNGDKYLLKEFKIEKISPRGLKARVRGEKLDMSRHTLKREIKAVTYHGLEIRKLNHEWQAQIIFDI